MFAPIETTEDHRPADLLGQAQTAGVAVGATPAWENSALCRSEGDTDLFFSEELQDIAAAKSICARCPVVAPCLEGAIERAEPAGVWGGQLFLNGRVLLVKRRRGRPPKHPRPEDHMPVVPVPDHLQELLRTA